MLLLHQLMTVTRGITAPLSAERNAWAADSPRAHHQQRLMDTNTGGRFGCFVNEKTPAVQQSHHTAATSGFKILTASSLNTKWVTPSPRPSVTFLPGGAWSSWSCAQGLPSTPCQGPDPERPGGNPAAASVNPLWEKASSQGLPREDAGNMEQLIQ